MDTTQTSKPRTRNAKPKIEEAALSLFIDNGIDATTTREIAERAGVSEGALYRHYKGKDELAEAMFFSTHERLSHLLLIAGTIDGSLQDRVDAIVGAYCTLADEDWRLCTYHLLNLNRFIPGDIRRDDDPVSLTEAIIEDLIESKSIPKGDPALLAAMCLGVVTQAAQNKAYDRLKGDLGDYRPAMVAAILAILNSSSGDT